jgi:DNA-binding XRE family transcriptional regulator
VGFSLFLFAGYISTSVTEWLFVHADFLYMPMTGNQLLAEIIQKGGVPGACAAIWQNDQQKTDQFILECFECSNSAVAANLWGAELIGHIRSYKETLNPKKKKVGEFDGEVINTIRKLRKQKGVKQSTLADLLQMTPANYSKIENGSRALTIGQLYLITLELNISLYEVFAALNREII